MNFPPLFQPATWKMTPKLLAAFLLTAILPVLAASLFSLNYFYGVSFSAAQLNLNQELGTTRVVLSDWAFQLESDTRQVAHENVVSINLELGLTTPVLDYLETLPYDRHLSAVRLLDAQGREVTRSSPVGFIDNGPLPTEDERALAREHSGLVNTRIAPDGRVLLLCLVPIVDGGGMVNGYLWSSSNPESTNRGDLLDSLEKLVSGPIVLVAQSGLRAQLPRVPVWDSGISWPTSTRAGEPPISVTSNGATYLFGFCRLLETDGPSSPLMGISFSLDRFQATTATASQGLILIALLCLLFSSFVAVFVARGLTAPLLTMAKQANAWKEGQGGQRLDVTTSDETGILGLAFNTALDRLDLTLDSLRKTQNYLKNIFNSLTSVLISMDETGTVQEWNFAAEQFSGIPAQEAIGKKVWVLSPVFEGLGSSLNWAVSSREPQFLKTDWGRGQDRRRFDIGLYPLVWNGVSGVVLRMDDITEILKKDQQLQQAQKMETVGTLTEGIAHNFNNLLTGITGTVSLLELELEQDGAIHPERLRERVAMIEESTQKASEIVRRLMALSRGGGDEFSTVDLAAVIREVAKTSRMVLDNSVEVNLEAVEGPALVYGDRSQLEQSLLNLIINAAHSMTLMRKRGERQGGVVTLSLQKMTAVKELLISHPEAVQSDYWLLKVRDRGVGIEPEHLSRVFDPFFTTKPIDKGSGLGLAMVYSAIRQHKGFVDVYSELGHGTSISLYLPVHHGGVEPPLAITSSEPVVRFRGEGLILVVDDEVIVQAAARMILESLGYQVLVASNGLEALELYELHGASIRAIILDSSMPKLSGSETLKALQKLNPGVRVLMSSGFAERLEEPVPVVGSLVVALPKPYGVIELSDALRRLFEMGMSDQPRMN